MWGIQFNGFYCNDARGEKSVLHMYNSLTISSQVFMKIHNITTHI